MKRRIVQISVALLVIAGGMTVLSRALTAQQISRGVFRLNVVPQSAAQFSDRVDTRGAPNLTLIGCEADIIATTTVNCLRLAGAPTLSPPSLQAIPATGGDANVSLALKGTGTGGPQLFGPGIQIGAQIAVSPFSSMNFGTCSVSPPSALTPAAGNVAGQTTCLAPSVTSTSKVFVQEIGVFPNFIFLNSISPNAGGTITLFFSCVTSGANCGTISSPSTFSWWTVNS